MGMVPAAIRRIAGPTRPVDAALRLSLNGRLFQESERRVSESNRERVPDEPTGSAAAVLRKRIGWIVFCAVSFFWLPILLIPFADFPNSVSPFAAFTFLALSSLPGLPLTLACWLVRWAGSPGGAWALLAVLAPVAFFFCLLVAPQVSSSQLGAALAAAALTAMVSLPIWLGYAILRIARFWERRAAGAGSGKGGGLGWEVRNRSGDPGEGA